MTELDKILKNFGQQIITEAVKIVRKELRQEQTKDIEAIVKDCLKKDQVYQESGSGFLTVKKICEKYGVSKMTVYRKCTEFNVERKQAGKNKLVNEIEFLKACEQPSAYPAFFDKSTD